MDIKTIFVLCGIFAFINAVPAVKSNELLTGHAETGFMEETKLERNKRVISPLIQFYAWVYTKLVVGSNSDTKDELPKLREGALEQEAFKLAETGVKEEASKQPEFKEETKLARKKRFIGLPLLPLLITNADNIQVKASRTKRQAKEEEIGGWVNWVKDKVIGTVSTVFKGISFVLKHI